MAFNDRPLTCHQRSAPKCNGTGLDNQPENIIMIIGPSFGWRCPIHIFAVKSKGILKKKFFSVFPTGSNLTQQFQFRRVKKFPNRVKNPVNPVLEQALFYPVRAVTMLKVLLQAAGGSSVVNPFLLQRRHSARSFSALSKNLQTLDLTGRLSIENSGLKPRTLGRNQQAKKNNISFRAFPDDDLACAWQFSDRQLCCTFPASGSPGTWHGHARVHMRMHDMPGQAT